VSKNNQSWPYPKKKFRIPLIYNHSRLWFRLYTTDNRVFLIVDYAPPSMLAEARFGIKSYPNCQ